jgi:hypothetical protein
MKKILFIAALFFSLPRGVFADALDMGAGARASGMAEAFTAVADDASALHYNPAGLSLMRRPELTAQYGQFLNGLTDSSSVKANDVAYAHPLKAGDHGTAAVSYHNFKGADYFDDRLITLGYGRALNAAWSAGLALKQFHRAYQPNQYTANALDDTGMASGQADPLFAKNGMNVDSYGVDAGLLRHFGKNNAHTAGLALLNVNRMDVSLGGNEKLPMTAALGVALRPSWGVLSADVRRVKRLSGTADMDFALGAERMMSIGNVGKMGLRGGYSQGSRDFKTLTTGVSFEISNIRLDYSFGFAMGNLEQAQGTHRAALTVRFGQAAAVAAPRESSLISHYLVRKAQGASSAERLTLLQKLLQNQKEAGADVTWIVAELASL